MILRIIYLIKYNKQNVLKFCLELKIFPFGTLNVLEGWTPMPTKVTLTHLVYIRSTIWLNRMIISFFFFLIFMIRWVDDGHLAKSIKLYLDNM